MISGAQIKLSLIKLKSEALAVLVRGEQKLGLQEIVVFLNEYDSQLRNWSDGVWHLGTSVAGRGPFRINDGGIIERLHAGLIVFFFFSFIVSSAIFFFPVVIYWRKSAITHFHPWAELKLVVSSWPMDYSRQSFDRERRKADEVYSRSIQPDHTVYRE